MNTRQLRNSAFVVAGIATALIGCGGSGSGGGTTTGTSGTTSGTTGSTGAAVKFVQANLVADTPGTATFTDANLVNPWGISAAPGGPFWVSDEATGKSTLYDGTGANQGLVVSIPSASGSPAGGPVTGQVDNGTSSFVISGLYPSQFIFASLDGVISAWYSGSSAVAEANRSANGAGYTGLALGVNGGANFLFAANFKGNTVDMFDGSFNFVSSFTDPNIPTGFAPFGIVNIGGSLYVSFAQQNPNGHGSLAGAGLGYVDVFGTNGSFIKRLISQGSLNAPWGMVLAPSGFGSFGGALLVGNFGDGHINAFNLSTGASLGALTGSTGAPVAIPGLWGLIFGSGGSAGQAGVLYFTAGPGAETHGLFGSLTASG